MATLWKKQINDDTYEIRSAGASIRLYTNDVFHSQWNPNRPVSGNIWDMLVLPALYLAPATIKRVLVLGVGGGAVIQLVKTLFNATCIIGIELNPVHLDIARRYFGVKPSQSLELIQGDAIQWLRSYTGEPFDLIIEDLYGEKGGEPERAIDLDTPWFSTLVKHLSKNGILVVNTINPRQLKACAFFSNPKINHHFQSAIRFSLPSFENAVGAFYKNHVSKKDRDRNIMMLADKKLIQALNASSFKQVKLK